MMENIEYHESNSEEGLEVLDLIRVYYLPWHKDVKLGELIALAKKHDYLSTEPDDVDILFDKTAVVLSELYFEFKETGELNHDLPGDILFAEVRSFTATRDDIETLLNYLRGIYDNIDYDEDNDNAVYHEYSELYAAREGWEEHIYTLLHKLKKEYIEMDY